jgi:hypothetical protein
VKWWLFLGQPYHQHENIQQSIYDISSILLRQIPQQGSNFGHSSLHLTLVSVAEGAMEM